MHGQCDIYGQCYTCQRGDLWRHFTLLVSLSRMPAILGWFQVDTKISTTQTTTVRYKALEFIFSNSLIIHEPNFQSVCWVWVMCMEFDTQ